MEPFGPPRKRPRADGVPVNGVNGNNNNNNNGGGGGGGHPGTDDYNKDGGSNSRTKPCTKFFSTSGCPYGEGCHFLHFVPGGVSSMGGMAPVANTASMGNAGPRKVVNVLAADDQGANLGGFKTRLCNRFDTAEGCRFAEKCHFAHGEKELRKSNSNSGPPRLERDNFSNVDFSRDRGPPSSAPYRGGGGGGGGLYGSDNNRFKTGGMGRERDNGGGGRFNGGNLGSYREPTPPGMAAAASFGASSTAKISIEASLAGAIIGKGGIHAKQICRLTGAKLSIREHETDPNLRNVEMEGSFEQIKQASQMVRQVLMQRDNVRLGLRAVLVLTTSKQSCVRITHRAHAHLRIVATLLTELPS